MMMQGRGGREEGRMRQAKERALDKGIIRIAIRLVKVCVVRLCACDAGTHKEGNTRQ
jgi:hypothetical protein